MFELRVIKQLGIVVNIILNITRRIVWFFLIFAAFIIGFSHALLHLLHTRRYKPCDQDGGPDGCTADLPDGFPKELGGALTTTYFFVVSNPFIIFLCPLYFARNAYSSNCVILNLYFRLVDLILLKTLSKKETLASVP